MLVPAHKVAAQLAALEDYSCSAATSSELSPTPPAAAATGARRGVSRLLFGPPATDEQPAELPQQRRRALVLVLNGSFNPAHVEHVSMLESARAHLESLGHLVVGGFLSPSSQDYVGSKKGPDAIPLAVRAHLCALTTSNNSWIAATRLGICSSSQAADTVLKHLTTEPGIGSSEINALCERKGIQLSAVHVMGMDTLDRFGIIRRATFGVPRRKKKQTSTTPISILAVERPGTMVTAAERRALADFGVETAVRSAGMSKDGVSSTQVLELLRGAQFAELERSGALHPAALAYLVAHH